MVAIHKETSSVFAIVDGCIERSETKENDISRDIWVRRGRRIDARGVGGSAAVASVARWRVSKECPAAAAAAAEGLLMIRSQRVETFIIQRRQQQQQQQRRELKSPV